MTNIITGLQDLAVPMSNLKPSQNNPRQGDVAAVTASYRQFGQRKPIVARRKGKAKGGYPQGEILAGNHQFEAAKALGWDSIAVVWVDDDDDTARAYAVADNRTGMLGGWDVEELVSSLEGLSGDLLAATSFTSEDLDDLMAQFQEASTVLQLDVQESDEQSGTRITATLGDYAERYANAATRVLMCDYPADQYVWLIEQLAKVRDDLGLTSNADAIVRLVQHYMKEQPQS